MRNLYPAFHAYKVDTAVLTSIREAAAEENSVFSQHLAECRAFDPWGTSRRTFGFIPILPDADFLFGEVQVGTYIFMVEVRTRVLPRSKVIDAANAAINDMDSASMTTAEKMAVRETIEIELLKTAPITTKIIPVIFRDPDMLFIFTASPSRADDVTALLKRAGLPSFVLTKWDNATAMLTNLALGDYKILQPDDSATLEGNDAAIIRVKDRDITSDSVRELINGNHSVIQLAIARMQGDDAQYTFTMNSKCIFKNLRYPKPSPEDDEATTFWSYALLAAAQAQQIVEDLTEFRDERLEDNDEL